MKKVTILIPAYNEEESLPYLYKRLEDLINSIDNYEFEILFVNDGSKDNTLNLIKEYRKQDSRISYVNFSRNFGKEVAMLAGFDYAKGDCVIIIDADLQDPPELIPTLLKYWEEGYDDVYAQRRSRKGETFLKKFTSKMYYRVLQKLTKVEIQKDTGDFRLLDRRCVNALRKMRETQRCSKSMFSWIGYKKKAVLYTSPLRISSFLAIPTFLMLIIYFIYVIVKCVRLGIPIQAFQATILLILFFSAIQIMLFGIVGEYLGRIFNETKNRPIYFVDEYNDVREENKIEQK